MKSMKEMVSFIIYVLIWIFIFKLSEQIFDYYQLERNEIIKICIISIIVLGMDILNFYGFVRVFLNFIA